MKLWLNFGAQFFSGGDVARFERDLAEDRQARAQGQEPRYAALDPDPSAEYYQRNMAFGEAELRNYKNRLTLRSFEPTIAHEITHLMRLISPKPLMMVLTEGDTMFAAQKEAFDAALEPKTLIVLPGHHYAL